MQSMTQCQAVLLMAVAGILRDRLDSNEPDAKTLTDAIADVAFELTALGIVTPGLAAAPSRPKAKKKAKKKRT
jgi:hypothetical protein